MSFSNGIPEAKRKTMHAPSSSLAAARQSVPAEPVAAQRRTGFWKRQLRQWHWISSALCLAFVTLFAITGITLNHAGTLEAEGASAVAEYDLPQDLTDRLARLEGEVMIPGDLASRIHAQTGVDVSGVPGRAEYGEIAFDLARPGRDANLVIALGERRAYHEEIDRGAIAMLNDLHKGRNAGPAWSLLIDLAAACFIVFGLTGFGLLWLQARSRPSTWPLTSFGLVLPLIAYILFVHI